MESPTFIPRSRRSIHSVSPERISNTHDESDYEEESKNDDNFEDSQTEYTSSENETEKRDIRLSSSYNNPPIVVSHQKGWSWLYCTAFVLVVAFSVLYIVPAYDEDFYVIEEKLQNLKLKFPDQSEDFFLTISVATNEIRKFNRPRTIFLLYNGSTISPLLKDITDYASTIIKGSSKKGLWIQGKKLIKYTSDYGNFLEDNNKLLNKEGVLIVENVDEIPAIVAQAFHSLCDEVNPYVKDLLVILTMKVDSFVETKKSGFISKRLRGIWNELESEKLEPLLTRITGSVLNVQL